MENVNVELKSVREKLDNLDDQIISLLDLRFVLVEEVIRVKNKFNAPVFQPDREIEMLERIEKLSKNPEFAKELLKKLIELSSKFQERKRRA